MNPEETAKKIAKFKARRLKAKLANYASFTSLFLSLSIFTSGFTPTSFISFLIILPLPLYFFRESLRFAQKSRIIKQNLAILESSISLLESKFSFKQFISQPNFTFRLSCILFFLVLFTTFARVRTQDISPTVTYHLESSF